MPCRTVYYGWHLTWGELARCEQPHMSQSQVSLARRMTPLYALGKLNHSIIRLSPLFWLVEGCSTCYRLRSRVSQVCGGKKDDLPVVPEFSKQRLLFGICTSTECPTRVRFCLRRRWRGQHTPATVPNNYVGQRFVQSHGYTDQPDQPVFGCGVGNRQL